MDLVLMLVGVVLLVACWRSRPASGDVSGLSALLLVGGALAFVVGAVVFGITFIDGFQDGYQRAQSR